ncbi:MAG: Flp family type IVb pilin [Marmoricola sp.]
MRISIGSSTRDESGASAVEYGLLVAGIAALIVAVVFLFGNMVSNVFGNSCGTVAHTITTSGTFSASC